MNISYLVLVYLRCSKLLCVKWDTGVRSGPTTTNSTATTTL